MYGEADDVPLVLNVALEGSSLNMKRFIRLSPDSLDGSTQTDVWTYLTVYRFSRNNNHDSI